MKDWVTGEEVTYQYDSINRLVSAVTTPDPGVPQWGLTFGYDGFGNKLTQALTKGSPPVHSFTVDPSTNRLNGLSYDSNGNQLPTASSTFDIENRLTLYQTGGERYGYTADNRRVWKYKPGRRRCTSSRFGGLGGGGWGRTSWMGLGRHHTSRR